MFDEIQFDVFLFLFDGSASLSLILRSFLNMFANENDPKSYYTFHK